jgi:hypothetical protein
MRKAMLAVALFAFVPAAAFAGPDQSARPAKTSPMPAQIATLGGDFPTTLSEEDLVANADGDTNPRAGYPQSNTSPERYREESARPATTEQQPQADTVPNGQPKYVHIYWFIGGR